MGIAQQSLHRQHVTQAQWALDTAVKHVAALDELEPKELASLQGTLLLLTLQLDRFAK